MVARIAFQPLIRVLNGTRIDKLWADAKLLLKHRRFAKRQSAKGKEPPPPLLFQMATGFWLSQAIYVAAKLGIGDLLEEGPQSSIALAAATHSDARSLFRVLRALSSAGVLQQSGEDSFALTRLGQALRSNVAGSLRAILVTLGEIHYGACGELLHSVRTGSPAFKRVFGTSLFDYLEQNPEAGTAFNQGMTDVAALLARAVLLAYDFSRITSIVDVGGGEGEFLRSILDLYPGIRGIVLDLPNGRPIAMGNGHGAERGSYVVGNFFDSVPSKAELYLLCGIIHDWSDERALVILKNCRKAMASDSRVLIVETIVPEIDLPSFSKILDLNMMVMTAGRERTKTEFHALLDAADFTITRIIPTIAPQSIVEATPKKK